MIKYLPTTSDDMLFPLQGSFQSMNFYDATLTYLDALNETLMEGGDYKNGTVILNKIRNRIVFSCKLHYNLIVPTFLLFNSVTMLVISSNQLCCLEKHVSLNISRFLLVCKGHHMQRHINHLKGMCPIHVNSYSVMVTAQII